MNSSEGPLGSIQRGAMLLKTGTSLALLTVRACALRRARAGNAQYPIGMHMTGPLRMALKKVPGHERMLLLTVRCLLVHCHPSYR